MNTREKAEKIISKAGTAYEQKDSIEVAQVYLDLLERINRTVPEIEREGRFYYSATQWVGLLKDKE